MPVGQKGTCKCNKKEVQEKGPPEGSPFLLLSTAPEQRKLAECFLCGLGRDFTAAVALGVEGFALVGHVAQ